MATARPFAYNPGTTIPGTEQLGNLSIGYPTSGFTNSPQYWNGPDEELGYVIAIPVPDNSQPTPLSGVTASVGFDRSLLLTESSFVELTNQIFNQNFTTGNDAKTWLNDNGYWTSFIPLSTPTPTVTNTPTVTPTNTNTPTNTSTSTQTPTTTTTLTATQTPTPSVTTTQTPSITPTNTTTRTPTVTPTNTRTPTNTPTLTPTNTRTPTPTPTPGALKVLFLGDGSVASIASNINTYINSTGQSITYSAVTIGTTYTGSGNITKANYDVVMIYTNSGQIGTTTMASALTTFVGQGGSIVSGTFLWNLYPSGYNFTGTTTFNISSQSNPPAGNIIITSATTITNGIGFTMPTTFNNGAITLNSGSVQLATYSNGNNLLAIKTIGSATLVGINACPINILNSTSTITKMFGNAILYAGGKI